MKRSKTQETKMIGTSKGKTNAQEKEIESTADPKQPHRGHNEGNIRQRSDGRWEVRLSAGLDYKTGKAKRTSTCCSTKQEAIAILQRQAYDVRVNGWRDPMSVTLGQWYEYWLETYMRDKIKQSTYSSYKSYGSKHFFALYGITLKKLEARTLQEFYNYKFREERLSPKTLRNLHMALHKCLQQAVKERLIIANPCEAVTLPTGEKPEISVMTIDQQRAVVQASYRHRYGVFVRLTLCTGLRMGELLALKWEDIDLNAGELRVRRTLNRLAKYEQEAGESRTEIVFDTPKTKNSRRTIPLTRSAVEELRRWQEVQRQDKIKAGGSYNDSGFVVTNEFGKYFEQKTFKDYYERILKDVGLSFKRVLSMLCQNLVYRNSNQDHNSNSYDLQNHCFVSFSFALFVDKSHFKHLLFLISLCTVCELLM